MSPDGKRWVSCKPGFFLSVRVLSRLFRRRFLETLEQAHRAGKLQFFGDSADLADPKACWSKLDWTAGSNGSDKGVEDSIWLIGRSMNRLDV